MRTLIRAALATAVLAAVLAAAAPRVFAQAATDSLVTTLTRGRFIVFDHGQPVATERFQYDRVADSMQVGAVIERRIRAKDGTIKAFHKTVSLVVDANDYGLRSYTSNTDFDGHKTIRGIQPGDTVMSVYSQNDEVGSADRIVQPPGRLFVMDPLVFTLFDVVCHTVQGHILKSRPISIVTLGATSATSQAMVTLAGADTIMWGGKRLISQRYTITDSSSTFHVWASPKGELLRLEHAESALVVLREEPPADPPAPGAPPAKKPARRPAAKRAPRAAKRS